MPKWKDNNLGDPNGGARVVDDKKKYKTGNILGSMQKRTI